MGVPEVLKPPRLSVIVSLPVWPPGQHRAGIERLIRSIFEQPDPISVEVVLAEDGSTDETLDYFKTAFPDAWRAGRLQIPNLERMMDGGRVRNAATQAASGTFIAYADSDVSWGNQRLSRLAPTLDAHDLIFGMVTEPGAIHDFTRALIQQNLVVPGSVVIRRTLLDAIAGYPAGSSGTPLPRALPATPEYELVLRASQHLTVLGRPGRIVALSNSDVRSERPPLSPEIAGLDRRLRTLRDGLALIRVFRSLPRRYWLETLKSILQRGRELAGRHPLRQTNQRQTKRNRSS